jgi:succinyl-CoA:acetate CoA-transferase
MRKKVVSPEEAASIVKDGMNVGTSGESTRGCASAFFEALAERGKCGEVKDLTLWSANILNETEKALAEAGMLRRRMGSHGDSTLRKAINSGKVQCNDIRSEVLPYLIRSNVFGKLDLAVVTATALTEEGFIVPSHVPVEIGSYVQVAEEIVIEIDCSIPEGIEGIYDHYLPVLTGNGASIVKEIPIYRVQDRVGTSFIPVDPNKVRHIIVSNKKKSGARKAAGDAKSDALAKHLASFLKNEIEKGRLPETLYPIEIGLGAVADAVLRSVANDFDMEIFGAVVSDSVLELIETGKCKAASATGMLISDEGWDRFCGNMSLFKSKIVLRPIEISNSPELVRRLRLIAINGALEADIYGQVNSSHINGVSLVNGIGGSAAFASNAHLSIFTLNSTSNADNISCIVPMVSHVDHTEHSVDVIVTERGLADLRGLSPDERAHEIIEKCAHPDYVPLLRAYHEKARGLVGGHEPHILAEAFSFHERLRNQKTMK